MYTLNNKVYCGTLIIVLTSNMIRKVTERQYFQSHIVKINHLILTYAACVNRFHYFTLIKNGNYNNDITLMRIKKISLDPMSCFLKMASRRWIKTWSLHQAICSLYHKHERAAPCSSCSRCRSSSNDVKLRTSLSWVRPFLSRFYCRTVWH